jgi:hypothetical protein
VKGAKVYNAAIAAVSDGAPAEKEGEEKLKVHTHSYCCLDYAQVYSSVSFLQICWIDYILFLQFEKLSNDFLSQKCQLFMCISPFYTNEYASLNDQTSSLSWLV